jgi:phage baseplate assembly protein W
MRGTDSHTGKPLSGAAHLRQSIRDILTTPVGSRVMRREYGSRLFDLVDNPLNADTLVDIFAATAEALLRWEPRLKVQRVQARAAGEAGKIEIDLEAIYLPTGQPVFLDGIVIS